MKSKGLMCSIFLTLTAVILFAPLTAKASELDKKTIVTFNQPVEIPNQVLPAGTYVFKMVDPELSQNVVEILNKDESKVIATLLTAPGSRNTNSDESTFELEERAQGAPMALKYWFYPGYTTGQEFLYSPIQRVEKEGN